MAPFYGWGSTAARPEPLGGGSLLFTTQFPEIPEITTDISYFRPYAETKNNGVEQTVCMKWIQFRSWFRPCDANVSSFIIQNYPLSKMPYNYARNLKFGM